MRAPPPSVPESVAQLDEADELRKLRAQADRRTAQLIPRALPRNVRLQKGRLAVQKMREIVACGDKINFGVVQPGDRFPDGVPLCRVGDFEEMEVSTAQLKRIDPAIESGYSRSRFIGDEILVACVGATIGKIALADESLRGFNIVRASARIRCGGGVDRYFLAWQRLSHALQTSFRKASRTVAQATPNIQQMEETLVLVPPLPLQKQFARRVAEIREMEAAQVASGRRLDDLFQSMLHRAFNGEL